MYMCINCMHVSAYIFVCLNVCVCRYHCEYICMHVCISPRQSAGLPLPMSMGVLVISGYISTAMPQHLM